MTDDRPLLRATLVADLPNPGTWHGRRCDDCDDEVTARTSWVVERAAGRALLCDDCTAAAWRAVRGGGGRGGDGDDQGRPWLRVVR